MKQGFPRPRFNLKEVKGWYITARMSKDELQSLVNKSYPHPYSARDNDLADVDPGRIKQCTYFKLCMVCGLKVDGDKVWVYRNSEGLNADSGPFHEKCMRLTQKLCPAVRTGIEKFKWSFDDWDDVAPIIRGKA